MDPGGVHVLHEQLGFVFQVGRQAFLALDLQGLSRVDGFCHSLDIAFGQVWKVPADLLRQGAFDLFALLIKLLEAFRCGFPDGPGRSSTVVDGGAGMQLLMLDLPVELEAFQRIEQLCRRRLVITMKFKQQIRIAGAGV